MIQPIQCASRVKPPSHTAVNAKKIQMFRHRNRRLKNGGLTGPFSTPLRCSHRMQGLTISSFTPAIATTVAASWMPLLSIPHVRINRSALQ